MTLETVTLKLPRQLLSDAGIVASAQDVTIGHLVRHLLAKEVARRLNPKTGNQVDDGLLAALQALFAKDMNAATDWDDLAARLHRHGYELRPVGAGGVLYKKSCNTRVCKSSELGPAYRALVKRFAKDAPGDPPQGALHLVAPQAMPEDALNSTAKGRLQRSLEPVFRTSANWDILIARLLKRGYVLRPMGRGTALYSALEGCHVCNTKTVGYRYRALVKKFGGAMPGHPYGADWIKDKDPLALPAPMEDPEFDVIDRG